MQVQITTRFNFSLDDLSLRREEQFSLGIRLDLHWLILAFLAVFGFVRWLVYVQCCSSFLRLVLFGFAGISWLIFLIQIWGDDSCYQLRKTSLKVHYFPSSMTNSTLITPFKHYLHSLLDSSAMNLSLWYSSKFSHSQYRTYLICFDTKSPHDLSLKSVFLTSGFHTSSKQQFLRLLSSESLMTSLNNAAKLGFSHFSESCFERIGYPWVFILINTVMTNFLSRFTDFTFLGQSAGHICLQCLFN